ncbi:hypothetical protein BDF20DRAFT_913298 [Mycotypha africana]|uniref:uncharacterized protein n=1 Tax=Mycotypha africana TaxID=64632 RepID=UPI00230114BC|nr:uncharacterized protein BDF20DRAFT_913298 [Mycotypha africana]KAI8979789.1 hypothetical protein BDF20DRAFT_913298 [Mycotypha africana]
MGRSAKFYKRPTKKEKEGLALKQLVEPSAIKKKATKESKTSSIAKALIDEAMKKKETSVANGDVDMTANESKLSAKKEKKQKSEPELPDYVDLFSGKKTYKKLPAKRK